MSQDTTTCRCGALVPIPEELAQRGEEIRRSLTTNTFGSPGSVRCSSCGRDSPLIVDAPLSAPS